MNIEHPTSNAQHPMWLGDAIGRILDCGGRAQRRHRFSTANRTSKAAWHIASRRSPIFFGCGWIPGLILQKCDNSQRRIASKLDQSKDSMKTRCLIAGLVLIAAMGALAATNNLTSALQKGLFEEEANRNLDAAISNYQALTTQFDQDRQIAATAIFRLGECYCKLGQTNDAVVQYQRILREFPEQQTLATLSQQNLTALHAAVPPQLMTAPQLPSPADTRDFQQRLLEILARSNADTNEFAQRLRAIMQEASLQDPADATARAAALEAEAAALKAQIARLSSLSGANRRTAIQQNFPNPVLTTLMQQLNEAEQNLASLTNDYAPTDLHVTRVTALVNAINGQIDAQVDGVIKGLQAKMEADRNTAKALRDKSGPIQVPEKQN
jgi:tetratricopeptide (TPR) repeat protein